MLTEGHRRRLSGQMHMPDTTPPTVPIRTPEFLPSRATKKLRATWLGHACYYIEFPSGLRVLFDPVFEDCCAPINLKNLKRYTPPPCEIEDLPVVDAVIISHNHYDHLSYPTIKRIHTKFPNVHFFAPLGNKKWFEKCGVRNVTELDWWESRDVRLETYKDKEEGESGSDGLSVTKSGEGNKEEGGITATIGALPCQHVSARTPFDKCKTLWASWSLESGGAKVWFAGYVFFRLFIYRPDYRILTNDIETQDTALFPTFLPVSMTTPTPMLTCRTARPLRKSASTGAPSISASSPSAPTSPAGSCRLCTRIPKTARISFWIQSAGKRWVCIGARGCSRRRLLWSPRGS